MVAVSTMTHFDRQRMRQNIRRVQKLQVGPLHRTKRRRVGGRRSALAASDWHAKRRETARVIASISPARSGVPGGAVRFCLPLGCGGRALDKLRLKRPARFSENIDLVQTKAEAAGPMMDAPRGVLDPWLGKPKWKRTEGRVTVVTRTTAGARYKRPGASSDSPRHRP